MSQMIAFHEKMSKDAMLKEQWNQIVTGAEQTGTKAAMEKLLVLAKGEGYDVSLLEMVEFFKTLSQQHSGELSDDELDLVSGGMREPVSALINIVYFKPPIKI